MIIERQPLFNVLNLHFFNGKCSPFATKNDGWTSKTQDFPTSDATFSSDMMVELHELMKRVKAALWKGFSV